MGGCASKGENTPSDAPVKKAGGGGGGGAPTAPKVDNTPKPFEIKVTREDGADAGEYTLNVMKTDKVNCTLLEPTGMDPYKFEADVEFNGKPVNPDDTFGGAGIAAGSALTVKALKERTPKELWTIVASDICALNKNVNQGQIEKLAEFNDDGSVKKVTLSILQLTKLPESLCSLEIEGDLKCNENNLTELPKGMGRLKVGAKCNFSNNKIKALPDSIINITVGSLDFGSNKIKKLPDKFSQIKVARNLLIDYNDIKKLPDDFPTIQVGNEIHVFGNPCVGQKTKLQPLLKEAGLSVQWNDPN